MNFFVVFRLIREEKVVKHVYIYFMVEFRNPIKKRRCTTVRLSVRQIDSCHAFKRIPTTKITSKTKRNKYPIVNAFPVRWTRNRYYSCFSKSIYNKTRVHFFKETAQIIKSVRPRKLFVIYPTSRSEPKQNNFNNAHAVCRSSKDFSCF